MALNRNQGSQSVSIEGQVYPSCWAAARTLNLNPQQLTFRLESSARRWRDWKYESRKYRERKRSILYYINVEYLKDPTEDQWEPFRCVQDILDQYGHTYSAYQRLTREKRIRYRVLDKRYYQRRLAYQAAKVMVEMEDALGEIMDQIHS